MSRSDSARARFNYNTRVRGSVRLAMAEIHQSQDSVGKDAQACDLGCKRKFDQLDLQTNVPSPTDYAPEELCSKCQQIDFEAAFQIPNIRLERKGVTVADLGRKGIEWGKTACPVCRLFADVCDRSDESSVEDTSHYHLRAFSFLKATENVSTTRDVPEPLSKADPPCLLVLGGDGSSQRQSPGEYCDFVQRPTHGYPSLWEALTYYAHFSGIVHPVVSSATEALSQFGTRRLLPDRIDYHLLRNWYSFCAQYHRKACAINSKEYPEMFKVIDCRTRRMIEAPPNCWYVALSYVWGQQQSTKASSSKITSENVEPRTLTSDTIPRVIEDAMIVTLELGWQYLWVDRYCIDQNDEEKHFQINQMDKIYLCAETTIVAAAGENANYGLPGVSSTLRRAQPYAVVRGQLLASTMRSPQVAIGGSRWATRGWTYQEAALSKKLLVFTDDQVFFECKGMSCSESHSVPLALLHEMKLEDGFGSSIGRGYFETHGGKIHGDTRIKFWSEVERFTARELSYEADSLNAFMGVINYYKNGQGSQSSPLYTYIGLPLDSDIYSSAEQPYCYGGQFVMSLLWIHEGKQVLPKRRRGSPSFSWAGWEGVASRPLGPHRSLDFHSSDFEPMARIVRNPGSAPELLTLPGNTIDLEADTVQGQIEVLDESGSRGPHVQFWLAECGTLIILPRDFLSRHKLSGGQTFFVDCILMGYQYYMSTLQHYWLMLIEYHGAIAERIGVTKHLDIAKERFQDLPKTRRIIRLG